MEKLIEELHKRLGKTLPKSDVHDPEDSIIRVLNLPQDEIRHMEEVLAEEGYPTLHSVPGWDVEEILDITKKISKDDGTDVQIGILTYDKKGGALYVEVNKRIKGALGMASRGVSSNQVFVVGGENKAQIAEALRAEAPHIFAKDKEEIPDLRMHAPGKIYTRGKWTCVNLDQEGTAMDLAKNILLYASLEKSGLTREKATEVCICKGGARYHANTASEILHLNGSPDGMMSIEVKGQDAEGKAMQVYNLVKEILKMEEKQLRNS